MRLTRAGVVAVLAVPALASVAWLFGQPELAIAAVALCVCLLAAAISVALGRARLELHRRIAPARVRLGEPCQVQITVRNIGRRRTRVLGIRDDVGAFGEACLHLAPLQAGAGSLATYSFPTQRRGLHSVGPLSVEVEDPFGLVRRRQTIAELHTAIVLAQTWPLAPLPGASGDEPEQGSRGVPSTSTVDEEFASMRQYAAGDDIRRIHWRTTARTGQLVVRQYDQPWQRRTTVLLDVRRRPYSSQHDADRFDDSAFERAVSTAASLVQRSADSGEMVRLLTTDGGDSGMVVAVEQLDGLLDRLAALHPVAEQTGAGTSPSAVLAPLGTRASGRLVTVTGRLSRQELDGCSNVAPGFGLRVIVHTDSGSGTASSTDTGATRRDGSGLGAAPHASATTTVNWDGTRTLTAVWETAIASHLGPTRPFDARPLDARARAGAEPSRPARSRR